MIFDYQQSEKHFGSIPVYLADTPATLVVHAFDGADGNCLIATVFEETVVNGVGVRFKDVRRLQNRLTQRVSLFDSDLTHLHIGLHVCLHI